MTDLLWVVYFIVPFFTIWWTIKDREYNRFFRGEDLYKNVIDNELLVVDKVDGRKYSYRKGSRILLLEKGEEVTGIQLNKNKRRELNRLFE